MTERRNAASIFQHSLKTPLSSVKVAAQLLKKHLGDSINEKDRELLEAIIRNAATLELRINKMIEFSTPWPDRIFFECDIEHLEQLHSLKFESSEPESKKEEPPEERIVIHADPEISDLIPRFLENRHKDISAVKAMLESSDFAGIKMLGHSMKGAGGGYGFNGISDIGKLIEDAAKEENPDKVHDALDLLSRYLQRVEVIYDEP